MTIDLDPFQYVIYLPPKTPGTSDGECSGIQVVWNRQGTKVAFIHDLIYPKPGTNSTDPNDYNALSCACTIFNVNGDSVTVAHRIPGKRYVRSFDDYPNVIYEDGTGKALSQVRVSGSWNADGTLFALSGDTGVTNRTRNPLTGNIHAVGGERLESELVIPPEGSPINSVYGAAWQSNSVIVIYETTDWTPVLRVSQPLEHVGYETINYIGSNNFNIDSKILSPDPNNPIRPRRDGYVNQDWSIGDLGNYGHCIFDHTDPYKLMIANMMFQFKDNVLKVIPYPRNEIYVVNEPFVDSREVYYIDYDVFHWTPFIHKDIYDNVITDLEQWLIDNPMPDYDLVKVVFTTRKHFIAGATKPIIWINNQLITPDGSFPMNGGVSSEYSKFLCPEVANPMRNPTQEGFDDSALIYQHIDALIHHPTDASKDGYIVVRSTDNINDPVTDASIEPYLVVYSNFGETVMPLPDTIDGPRSIVPPGNINPVLIRQYNPKYVATGGNKVILSRYRNLPFPEDDAWKTWWYVNYDLPAVAMYTISGGSLSPSSVNINTLRTFDPGPMGINPAGNKLAIFNNTTGQNHFVIINV